MTQTAPPPPARPQPTVPQYLDRPALDALLRARLEERLAAAEKLSGAAQRSARDAARGLERDTRAFAAACEDAGLPYELGVAVRGSRRTLACIAVDYQETPLYWQIVAGGTAEVIAGSDLLGELGREPTEG